jgi:heme exporter protein A
MGVCWREAALLSMIAGAEERLPAPACRAYRIFRNRRPARAPTDAPPLAEPIQKLPPVHVEADDLACVRGGRPVFAGASFEVGPGECLAVIGPNGSGKTSLLRILAGLLPPAGGRLGIRPGEPPPLDFLGHADGLKPALTLADNLGFWTRLFGVPSGEATIAEAAGRVGLGHAVDLPAGVLSAGQRRRAGLARLLLSRRPLWLLDEPGAALDSDGEAILGVLMESHLSAGGAIVAATHQPLPVAPTATLSLAP